MKKLFYAAAATAVVLSVANVEAKGHNDVVVHNYYMNGEIKECTHDMLLTNNLWKVKNRNHKQMWYAVDDMDRDVISKIKGNDYKSFVKVKIDGEKGFVKDIDPANKKKHVAKVKEDDEKYVVKDVVRHNGTEIISGKNR